MLKLYLSLHRIYDLAMISYGIAWFHFVSEFVVFGTAGLKGAISPFIVSSESQSLYLPLWFTTCFARAFD